MGGAKGPEGFNLIALFFMCLTILCTNYRWVIAWCRISTILLMLRDLIDPMRLRLFMMSVRCLFLQSSEEPPCCISST
jgi:hypothetical protein